MMPALAASYSALNVPATARRGRRDGPSGSEESVGVVRVVVIPTAVGDVLADGEVRKERVLLEDEPEPA